MQLQEYLDRTKPHDTTLKTHYARFGKQLGVSLHCIRKWVGGQRRINDAMKLKIEQVTKGKVSIGDMVRG